MTNETIDVKELESQFEPIDDIVCYECRQTRIGACIWLDGECPLRMFD